MAAGFLRRQLRRRPLTLLLLGLFFVLAFGVPAFGLLRRTLSGNHAGDDLIFPLLLFLGLWVLGIALVAWGTVAWRRLDRHPDLLALGRYGPPAEVLSAIDAELADPEQVVRLGEVTKSFHMSRVEGAGEYAGEVLFSPSWLVCRFGEDGLRFACMRLDGIVWAFRQPTPPTFALENPLPYKAVLFDRHGACLEVPGTEQAVVRLLAEVIARVPWALNWFDDEARRNWTEDREQFIAAVDRRREEIR